MPELFPEFYKLLTDFSNEGLIAKVTLAGGTAVLTAIGKGTLMCVNWLRRRVRWHTKTYRISLKPREGLDPTINRENYGQLSQEITGFYCIVPRFGTEEYLERFANDEERAEGRWRMKVIKLPVEFDGAGNAELLLRLPVHKFLGTQFKCFVALKAEADLAARVDRWTKLLLRCRSVPLKSIGNPNTETVGQGAGLGRYNRLYFLLMQFSECSAGPTIQNNFILDEIGDFPVADPHYFPDADRRG